MPTALEVGQRLVELCKKNDNLKAVDELYADGIVSSEAHGMPGSPKVTSGKAAVRTKNESWLANHTVHEMTTEGPWPHDDQFIVNFFIDITPKVGPMAGKRMQMKEAALYTVANGKIVKEDFFYAMGG